MPESKVVYVFILSGFVSQSPGHTGMDIHRPNCFIWTTKNVTIRRVCQWNRNRNDLVRIQQKSIIM